MPALNEAGVRVQRWEDLDRPQKDELNQMFRERIFPVLTPLAVDSGRPFPYISNLSLNLAVMVRDVGAGKIHFARIKVPPLLPRFVPFGEGRCFVPLEDLIAANLDQLFPGMEILEHHTVPRDAQRRPRDRRRRGRPAGGAGGAAAAPPLPARRAAGGRAVDAAAPARAPDGRAGGEPAGRLRPPGAARPRRPVGPPLDRPPGPQGRALRPGHPPRPVGRGRRGDADLRRRARPRRARSPPLRVLHHERAALHRGSGRRPGRARDQADALPDGRQPDRGRPDRGRGARQAGGGAGRDQGALRREREHHAGRGRWSRRAATSCTASPG